MKRSIRWKVILACIIVFIIGIVIYFLGFTGFVAIDTLPSGAAIDIDGNRVGNSPIKKRVFIGMHRIKAIKYGYGVMSDDVRVERGKTIAITRRLPALIQSNPSGAAVYIDGEYKGETPLSFEFEPGYHRVMLKKMHYIDVVKIFRVAEAPMKPMPVFHLTKAEILYPVSITSKPREAKIYIDREWRGVTPKKLQLPRGHYFIRLSKDGYQDIIDEFTVPNAKEYAAKLKARIAYGSISINALPYSVIYLDGQKKGETPIELSQIPVGKHTIRFTRPGYKDIRREVNLEDDQKITIGIKLDEWMLDWR